MPKILNWKRAYSQPAVRTRLWFSDSACMLPAIGRAPPHRASLGFALIVPLLLSLFSFWLPLTGHAETLGRVTSVDYGSSYIEIEGRRYIVGAQTSIFAADAENRLETVTFRSLAVNDYVLYEERDGRLLKLQKVRRDTIDVAPPRSTPRNGDRLD
ncbi:MAG: hypothetical protein V2I45_02690 [Halieaceae bacterium]|jgi:hypothetical protein|nr:hypothetical protein [Halieaceae bacterium]